MSVLVESSMGELNEDRRAVYPLFTKGSKLNEPTIDKADDSRFPDGQNENVATAWTSNSSNSDWASTCVVPETTTSTSLAQNHAELLDVDPNDSRRKRQKTTSIDGKGHPIMSELPAPSHMYGPKRQPLQNPPIWAEQQAASTPEVFNLPTIVPNSDQETSGQSIEDVVNVEIFQRKEDGEHTHGLEDIEGTSKCTPLPLQAGTDTGGTSIELKPRKVLKLNPKTGTFGSPPRKPIPLTEVKPKKTAARGKQRKSRLVVIRYNPSIGTKIDQILKSAKPEVLLSKEQIQGTALPKTVNIASKPNKSLHPLFLGKLAARANPQKSSSKDGAITDLTILSSPSKPKSNNSRLPTVKPNGPLFSGFGNTSKLVKFPGAVEPAWPWKGMLHVRGNDSSLMSSSEGLSPIIEQKRSKKSKQNATQIPATEDIIETLRVDLRIGEIATSIQHLDLDEYPIPPPSLRTSIKHHDSGAGIQKRIRKELHVRPPTDSSKQLDDSSSEDDVRPYGSKPVQLHPALADRFASIATSLSAFDRGECENQGWTSKYAPRHAAEVLQAGDEAMILKGWLRALTVNSVTVTSGPSLSKKAKKRKRKSKKLDGFIVNGDDDEFLQDNETSDNDSDVPPNEIKKTFVHQRLSKVTGKPNNAILLSGPHGCGKTAAVYAVAKELGFEIFEINSSSRRSGKDITDKVGDMTRNHLVQHSAVNVPAELDSDEQRVDDALADDLKSGRQGTMNSFFKAQSTKPELKPTKTSQEKPVVCQGPDTSRQPPREQKQSLILIEEVDVLYKEDTQFWPTIVNLIQSSKRPIVMTCNDESLLDKSLLALHGILRFTPPPMNLAVDYMLMVAACEGHVLQRVAVQSLYETRGLDLRASLTELNYWCQFGVGSVRGGLDWFYSRFPRGSDVDKNGNTIRVVSEGTYQAGMGCLSQDYFESHLHHLDIEKEMLCEAWDHWQLDTGEWQASLDMQKWANRQDQQKPHLQAALSMYEQFAESMSDADLCSHGNMAVDLQVKLDTNTLEPTHKALDDYVLPHRILKASTTVDYSSMREISLWMRSEARAFLQVDQHIKHDLEVPPELDRLNEAGLMHLIRKRATQPNTNICRNFIDYAFEPISNAEKPYAWSNSPPLISVFSGALGPIVEDVAPYVRSIVEYDARLAQDRIRMSNLLSEGGTRGKRMRSTRSAMSALEGGARKETRREKYFNDQLNSYLVSRTGMQSWIDISFAQIEADRAAASALDTARARNESVESERADIDCY